MSQGAAPNLAAAGQRLSRKLWLMLGAGLICPPIGMFYAMKEWGRAILTATAAVDGDGWGGLRMLTRTIGLLVALTPMALVLFDPSIHGMAWVFGPPTLLVVFLAVFSAWILPLTQPGSAARRSVIRRLGVMLATLAMPVLAALSWSHNPGTMVYALTILAPLLIVPQISGLLGVFRGTAGPTGLLLDRLAALLSPMLSVRRRPFGLDASGVIEGHPVSVSADLRRIPASVTIQLDLPPALAGLSIRARRDGETGGTPLTDMLLSQLLIVDGIAQADALLSGLHDRLLPVLHAWPDARIVDGRLLLRIDLISASTILQIPDLLTDTARLVAALCERAEHASTPRASGAAAHQRATEPAR